MQLLPERPATVPPGICFICEMANDMPYVDTGYGFDPPIPTHLNGRKFVCAGCIADMGKLIGLVPESEVEAVKAELTESYAEVSKHHAIDDLIRAMAEFQKQYPAPTTQRAPKADATPVEA